jgi:hypothetical protein
MADQTLQAPFRARLPIRDGRRQRSSSPANLNGATDLSYCLRRKNLCATGLFADKVQPFVAMLSVLLLEFVPEKHASGFVRCVQAGFFF